MKSFFSKSGSIILRRTMGTSNGNGLFRFNMSSSSFCCGRVSAKMIVPRVHPVTARFMSSPSSSSTTPPTAPSSDTRSNDIMEDEELFPEIGNDNVAAVENSYDSSAFDGESLFTDQAAAADAAAGAAAAGGDVAATTATSSWPNVQGAIHLLDWVHGAVGPWWLSIMLVTVTVRLLTLPVVVMSMKNSARMLVLQPKVDKLKKQFERRKALVPDGAPGARELQMEEMQAVQALFKQHNVRFRYMFLPILVQAPMFMTFFFALRNMCETRALEFATGGIFWFTDLAAADPYYRLPIMSGLTTSAILLLGADGMPPARQGPMRMLAFAMLPLMVFVTGHFEQALHVYWVSSNTFSLGWTLFMRAPGPRAFVGLPPQPSRHQDQTAAADDLSHVGSGRVEFFNDGRQSAVDFRKPPDDGNDDDVAAAATDHEASEEVKEASVVSTATRATRKPRRPSRKRRTRK